METTALNVSFSSKPKVLAGRLKTSAKVLSVFFLSFFSQTATSETLDQQNSAQPNNDFEEVSQHFPSDCKYQASFTQSKTLIDIDKSFESSGDLLFDCNKGMVWHTASPIHDTTLNKMTGSSLKTYKIAGGEVSEIKDKAQRRISKMIYAIMSGDQKYLNRLFSATVSDKGIELLPKRKSLAKFISRIDIQKLDLRAKVKISMPQSQLALDIDNLTILDENSAFDCGHFGENLSLACQSLEQ